MLNHWKTWKDDRKKNHTLNYNNGIQMIKQLTVSLLDGFLRLISVFVMRARGVGTMLCATSKCAVQFLRMLNVHS